MPAIQKHCQYCNQRLINKRADTKHCSSSCRSKSWRAVQDKATSVKVVLSSTQLKHIKAQADQLGLLINQLIVLRATNTDANTPQYKEDARCE